MKLYFSGFSLKNEQELFKEYLEKSDFIVSGFSYGAIKAVEYALDSHNRIDKLQLFSPAFFNDKDTKYKRMQLMYFKKDPKLYCANFLKNSNFTKELVMQYFEMGTYEELYELLHYPWTTENLQKIKNKNITLEVFLGAEDKIINAQKAMNFFKEFGEVYYIKDKGHIL
ncbi:MAG: pimelyl-ACP methyl ester esterase BioV [Arcobacteraceae bacterium]